MVRYVLALVFLSSLLSQEEDLSKLKLRVKKYQNWVISREKDITGKTFVVFNCGETTVTIVCDESFRNCGPSGTKLDDAFKEHCMPYLESFYGLKEKKSQKRR
ncbi:MAG: hypothetical protein N2654_02785 [Deltaproteobacteria bacterium]|nr:hypothetical protein [Deltaproteobacteria bacterium]